MSQGYFVTGTDTGVGKTWATLALMKRLKQEGLIVAGMKPIASGAKMIDGHLINADAEQIAQASSISVSYDQVNPVVFSEPIAPHIAADLKETRIDLRGIESAYNKLITNNQIVFVEGIGGWRVPFSDKLSSYDLAKRLNLKIILVVGLRLGCINHSLLTAERIIADGLDLFAWMPSEVDNTYLYKARTLKTLSDQLSSPLLGILPHADSHELADLQIYPELLRQMKSY